MSNLSLEGGEGNPLLSTCKRNTNITFFSYDKIKYKLFDNLLFLYYYLTILSK